MKFLKQHKVGIIIISVCLILLVLLFFGIKNAFFSNIGESKYGNRLDGIENYPIDDVLVDEIKDMLIQTNNVNNVTYDLEGRIINFVIEVKNDVDLTTSRSLADKIAEKFTEEYKAFYDIQIFLICEDAESELYPTIGYKHKTSVGFKWNVG